MSKLNGTQILNKALDQAEEDRDTLLKLFNDLQTKIEGLEQYALHGQTLGKYAELLVKQTSQLVELAKLTSKNINETDSTLSIADLEQAQEEIDKKKKVA